MKIKFIKEYRALLDDNTCRTYRVGQTWSVNITLAQWLIGNGFAEEVKESGWWKPKLGDIYYVAYPDGLIASFTWDGCTVDLNRFLNGAVFKTKEATRRWRDYFDTREHALNSAMNHTREWQTILNYDWSRE